MVSCVSGWQHGSAALLWCALLSVPLHSQSPAFCFIKDFGVLRLDFMLKSLKDLNHIFLFLIRILYKGSLCFLAVYISFTVFVWEIAVRGSWCGARLRERKYPVLTGYWCILCLFRPSSWMCSVHYCSTTFSTRFFSNYAGAALLRIARSCLQVWQLK